MALLVLGGCVTTMMGGFSVAEESVREGWFAGKAAWVAERELEITKESLRTGVLAPGPRALVSRYHPVGMERPRILLGPRTADGCVRVAVRCLGPASRSFQLESFVHVPMTTPAQPAGPVITGNEAGSETYILHTPSILTASSTDSTDTAALSPHEEPQAASPSSGFLPATDHDAVGAASAAVELDEYLPLVIDASPGSAPLTVENGSVTVAPGTSHE